MTHTPVPWIASESNWGQFSVGPAHNVIAVTYSLGSEGGSVDAGANAAFIVKAVNSHEALVKALQLAEAVLNEVALKMGGRLECLAAIRKALADVGASYLMPSHLSQEQQP